MHDDDLMDRLLRDAMTAEAPRLSPAFDARVMRAVRPPRLTPMGRIVMVVYVVAATAAAVWLMRDVPMEWIAAAAVVCAPIAAGASAYGRRLAAC
jgi:hypothetical protein